MPTRGGHNKQSGAQVEGTSAGLGTASKQTCQSSALLLKQRAAPGKRSRTSVKLLLQRSALYSCALLLLLDAAFCILRRVL